MKAIMYHYVRPDAEGLPHFPYLALEDFERQLDHFAASYGFAGRDAFEKWLAGGPAPQGILLTFDDGLRDHVDFVLPALQRRGLFALFYVPSAPILEGALLDVHKVHLALGRLGGPAAWAWLQAREPGIEPLPVQHDTKHYAKQSADAATKHIKSLFNWRLDEAQRQPALDSLLTFAFDGEPPHWRDFYLDEGDVRRLRDAGMGVGAHGHRHAVLNRLTVDRQRSEIWRSCDMVRSLVGSLDGGYCYAYGAFDAMTQQIVNDAGCPFAFAVEDGDLTLPLRDARRYRLQRYNCNVFPHGTVSFTPAMHHDGAKS